MAEASTYKPLSLTFKKPEDLNLQLSNSNKTVSRVKDGQWTDVLFEPAIPQDRIEFTVNIDSISSSKGAFLICVGLLIGEKVKKGDKEEFEIDEAWSFDVSDGLVKYWKTEGKKLETLAPEGGKHSADYLKALGRNDKFKVEAGDKIKVLFDGVGQKKTLAFEHNKIAIAPPVEILKGLDNDKLAKLTAFLVIHFTGQSISIV